MVQRLTILVVLVCVRLQSEVNASCSGGGGGFTSYNGVSGQVKSVGYPNIDYVKGQTCTWVVYLSYLTKHILLEITDMEIYKDPTLNCSQADYLRIENHNDDTEVWADYLCGNSTTTITGTTYTAKIIFVASSIGTSGKGFSISWSGITAPTTTETTSTTEAPTTTEPASTTEATTWWTTTNIMIIAIVGGSLVVTTIGAAIGYIVKKNQNDRTEQLQRDYERDTVEPIKHRRISRVEPTVTQQTESETPKQSFVPLTSPAWTPGINLAPAPQKPKPKEPVKEERKPVLPHIMISYQWDVKPEVLEFRERLADAGYRVWIDVEQMHKGTSTFESMANAVDNSVVVVPVLTAKYQESINCRKEIEFADKRKKTLVPICMQKDYKVKGWLEFLIGSATKHVLCDDDCYDEELEKFFAAIEVLAKPAKIEEEKDEEEESND